MAIALITGTVEQNRAAVRHGIQVFSTFIMNIPNDRHINI